MTKPVTQTELELARQLREARAEIEIWKKVNEQDCAYYERKLAERDERINELEKIIEEAPCPEHNGREADKGICGC